MGDSTRNRLTNRSSQPLAVPMSSFYDDFNIEIRSSARSRQRWLSSVSLDRLVSHGFPA